MCATLYMYVRQGEWSIVNEHLGVRVEPKKYKGSYVCHVNLRQFCV
jgi:hypothetical protein